MKYQIEKGDDGRYGIVDHNGSVVFESTMTKEEAESELEMIMDSDKD